MASLAAGAAMDKKALDIRILDIGEVSVLADYFVICSGASYIQVKSIADGIKEELQKAGYELGHVEGYREGKWILLDYRDIVVHVFHSREREFYNLEKLWGDAKVLVFDPL